MVRKRQRLSDLLREESQRSSTPEADSVATPVSAVEMVSVVEESVTPATPQPASATSNPSTDSRPSLSAANPLIEVTQSEAPQSEAPQSEAANSQLTVKVAELTAALATAQHQEAGWQEHISNLQSQLHEQTALVENLHTDLTQAHQTLNQTKLELEQAKQDLLRLSAINSQPLPEAKLPELAQKLPQAESIRSSGLLSPQSRSPQAQSQLPLPIPRSPQPLVVKPLPQYSVRTEQPTPMVSNEEIGWFD